MQNLITTRENLKMIEAFKGKDSRFCRFWKLEDGRVLATNGQRLVLIRHESFNTLAAGSYTFASKPKYTKALGEVIVDIEKEQFLAPALDRVLFTPEKTQDIRLDCEIAYTALILTLFKMGLAVNFRLVEDLPDYLFTVGIDTGKTKAAFFHNKGEVEIVIMGYVFKG